MNVIPRNGYYYLMHSFRKNNHVVTKEKYIGKEIPNNIDTMKECFLRECMHDGVFPVLEKIKNNFRCEWNSFPASVKRELLINLSIEFTYNTNAIEGSTLTLEDTEELIRRKIAPHKPLRDVQETLAHAAVFFRVMEAPPLISLKTLLGWHLEIFGATKADIAGKFRDYLVRVGDYVAPDWQDVEKLIHKLVRWCGANDLVMNPIELAARVHYKFEKIHPFGDGNGRIGRLIIAALLQRHHYPPLVIEYKRRVSYYKALSKTENEFVMYFIRRYVAVHKKYVHILN